MNKSSRLPRNFHKSFKPERQYIHAMLRYAAAGKSGDFQEISAATGIPMGTSSGKVPAILDYCRGMGLIQLGKTGPSAVKTPELTNFGRVVVLEDPFLKLEITQWIVHFNMCCPVSGAEVWHLTFANLGQILGSRFRRSELEKQLGYLMKLENPTGVIGPLIGTYEEEAALKTCGALSECNGDVRRSPAPVKEEFGFAYGAWLLQLMEKHFPKNAQVSITELDANAAWRAITQWDAGTQQRVMNLVERKGLLTVDRHMDPWLLSPKCSSETAWRQMYDDVM